MLQAYQLWAHNTISTNHDLLPRKLTWNLKNHPFQKGPVIWTQPGFLGNPVVWVVGVNETNLKLLLMAEILHQSRLVVDLINSI